MSAPITNLPDDEYLTANEVRELHQRLQATLDELRVQGSSAVNQLTQEEQAAPDHVDLATSSGDREQVVRLAERERLFARKVQAALKRIAAGDYGTCDACGGEISYARLLARPVATQCIDCQSETERQAPRHSAR